MDFFGKQVFAPLRERFIRGHPRNPRFLQFFGNLHETKTGAACAGADPVRSAPARDSEPPTSCWWCQG
jgi:hypothetical protein